MSIGQLKLLRAILRAGAPSESLPVEQVRRNFDRLLSRFPQVPDLEVESVEVAGRPAEWLGLPGASDDGAILYLHGGGCVTGSLRSHRQVAGRVAAAAGVRCLNLEYRLSPEVRWPVALDDAGGALAALIERFGAARVAVAGDSAGATLGLLAVLDRRDAGLALPAAIAAICPWGDFTGGTPSLEGNAHLDPMVQRPGLEHMARLYLGDADPWHPRVTPLRADLRGLPPVLIQTGTDDALVDDALALTERAVRAGVHLELEVWAGMIHVWHLFAGRLEEADRALKRVGAFLGRWILAPELQRDRWGGLDA